MIGVPEGKKTEKGAERVFEELIIENVPNLMKEMNINIQKAQLTPSRKNSKMIRTRHNVIKLLKSKD